MNDKMLILNRFSIPDYDTQEFKAYERLILPQALERLKELTAEEGYWVATEARLDGELVGCAMAQYFSINQTAQLYSLVVKENYRQRGIGQALFQCLETTLKEQDHIFALGFEYEKNDAYAPAIEKILAHRQWNPPKLYLVRCHFDAYAFNPRWIHLANRFPPEMELFKWKDLTAEERKRIAFMRDQGMFLPYLSPFREEQQIDLPTSVGLRYKNQVIGWSITHRLDPDTLRYSALYIDKDFQFSGYGILLLSESIRLHKQLPIPRAIFEINLQEIDLSWRRFVKKRLIPISDRVERMKWAIQIYI